MKNIPDPLPRPSNSSRSSNPASPLSGRLRWGTSAATFIITISLANAMLYNFPLFAFAVNHLDGISANGLLILTTLLVTVFSITSVSLFLAALVTHRLIKPVCMVLALCNSIALYFITTYQVILDRSMMGNVFNTNTAEATSYFHPDLFLYLLAFGVVPCWIFARTRVRKTARSGVALLAFAFAFVGLGWVYLASSTWLWFDDHAKSLGGLVVPWSYIANTVRYQSANLSRSREQILLPPATFAGDGKIAVVLVIGEAARAKNFSLYGYDRPTNPLLSGSGAVALRNTSACSTYTTASLRCMLSPNGASSDLFENLEPLPSYLYRHGVDVIWRSKNWGEPPIQVSSHERIEDLVASCEGNECDFDEIMLTGLSERIRSSQQQRVFAVLHQKGSHGPNYFDQYPERFGVFKPVCTSVELNHCTNESLVNAYDNTILYDDYFLHEVIGILSGMRDRRTLLIYVSDHGESLGEYGLYLHGTPFSLAPAVQKDVPFIVWMSQAFIDGKGISVDRMKEEEQHSHGNVFHSVMGAFEMHSDVYDSQLDIFDTEADGEVGPSPPPEVK